MVYDDVAPFLSMSNNVYKEINSIFNLWDIAFYGNNYDHNVDCVINGKYDKDYKVIIVGDAQMAPEELFEKNGNYRGPNDGLSGYEWCELLIKKYKKVVWMNPRYHKSLTENHWMESENALSKLFHMYTLSVDGLKEAITYLLKTK